MLCTVASITPDFSVAPSEGYLQPNEDTNIEITFHPQSVNRDIRYERIPLYVDGQAPLQQRWRALTVGVG